MANILWPVDDLAVALAFYRNAVGLPVRFTGGERFAALDAGGTTLALVAGGEDVTSGAPAISVKVADVADAVERLTGAGARIVSPPSEGPPRDPRGAA